MKKQLLTGIVLLSSISAFANVSSFNGEYKLIENQSGCKKGIALTENSSKPNTVIGYRKARDGAY